MALISVTSLLLLPLAIAADPQPILATAGADFLGYDGQWSPISIRIGTPEQWISVLPATLSQETWVIGPGGCDGTSTCESVRGGVFDSSQSSTFQPYGLYELGATPGVASGSFGYYGLDTVALNDGVSEPDQIVSVINTTEVLLGELGLGVQQTRLNGSENVLPLLSSLVQNNSVIPSHSYGYTAGAAYRLKGVPASLALGGIDANRFAPNSMSFTLSSDYAPVIAINSITVSSSGLPLNWDSNPMQLLDESQAETFTIDTSTPFLWLPEAVCDNFANALNLTYNDDLQLYFYANDTSPSSLDAWDLAFNFSIGNLPGANDNIELSLPYGAFNLKLSFPYPGLDANFSSASVDYFPLRRASNDSQYIIGRAFLQETYLTVDYERNNFSLSQAVFTEEAVNNVALYAITRPDDSIFPGPTSSSSGLTTGAQAGIGVGIALAVIAAAVLIWCCCFRKRRSADFEAVSEKTPQRRSIFSRWTRSSASNTTVSELLGDRRHPVEAPADRTTSRFELAGSAPIEMPAAAVSPTFLQDRSSSSGVPSRNDPRQPAELEQARNAAAKEAEAAANAAASDRSHSPVPPYSPSELQQRFSSSISPNSVRHSHNFGTHSSGENGVSPIGNGSGHGSDPLSQRSSANNSNPISPISPEATVPRGGLLSPANTGLGRVPSRSPSRSRFVEEGLSEHSNSHSGSWSDHDQTPQPGTQGTRFSWEQ
jgi:hypothetical protein